LTGDIGSQLLVEPLDCTDRAAFVRLGERFKITGIVHLAASAPGRDVLAGIDAHLRAVLNALEAATRWRVRRVSIASTLGVYLGVTAIPFREDAPLPMTPVDPSPALTKSSELIGALVADSAAIEVINLRISTVWGPLRRANEPPFAALPALVRTGAAPTQPVHPDGGRDVCYVKDVARGIALLQITQQLNHRTYNVADGRVSSNREIVAAIREVMPGARVELQPSRDPHSAGQDGHLDISRIHEDTGYRPQYGLTRGIADYVDWLRAGHEY
jgi:UDP-glucose 4-epimerase